MSRGKVATALFVEPVQPAAEKAQPPPAKKAASKRPPAAPRRRKTKKKIYSITVTPAGLNPDRLMFEYFGHAKGYATLFATSRHAKADLIVPAGTQLYSQTDDPEVTGPIFATSEEVAIRAGEVAVRAPIHAVEPGLQGNIDAGLIYELRRPVQGIRRVTNEEPTWGGAKEGAGPKFTVKEVGKTFFAKGPDWMRLVEREGGLTYDGKPIEIGRSQSDFRVFDLPTIEKIIHGLAQNEKITGHDAVLALITLATIGRIHRFLPSDD